MPRASKFGRVLTGGLHKVMEDSTKGWRTQQSHVIILSRVSRGHVENLKTSICISTSFIAAKLGRADA